MRVVFACYTRIQFRHLDRCSHAFINNPCLTDCALFHRCRAARRLCAERIGFRARARRLDVCRLRAAHFD